MGVAPVVPLAVVGAEDEGFWTSSGLLPLPKLPKLPRLVCVVGLLLGERIVGRTFTEELLLVVLVVFGGDPANTEVDGDDEVDGEPGLIDFLLGLIKSPIKSMSGLLGR